MALEVMLVGETEKTSHISIKGTVTWKRVNKNTILIEEVDGSNHAKIKYRMENHKGPNDIEYLKLYYPKDRLGKTDTFCFWIVPCELYKKL